MTRKNLHFSILILKSLLIIYLLINNPALAERTAKQLFEDSKQLVYQVRVIDLASGDRFSYGSGFQVSEAGHIATNFHVVSSFVHEQDKYRLEVIQNNGIVIDARLLSIDIVHDLAVLQVETEQKQFFLLKNTLLSKGDRIYSMGNPLDLGMTIVEGTYNGLIQISRYQKILFSGSLNSGMSGGPAFDTEGEIIGINVSKSGDQISFLVPVERLSDLIQQAVKNPATEDFKQAITLSLKDDQERFYKGLLNTSFKLEPLGKMRLPGKISQALKCWGHTVDQQDIKYDGVHQHCRSKDEIYINEDFHTGTFSFDYEWLTTKKLNRIQFYHLLEERFSHLSQTSTKDSEHITNYRCYDNFITFDKHSWKASSCFRAYKQYSGLYDALLLLATVDQNDEAMIIRVGASGISQQNARLFFNKMLGSMQWNN